MLSAEDAEAIVKTIFDRISQRLAEGGRVELRGFGVFGTKQRDARTGRNPRNGVPVAVEGKSVPYFKTGKLLRQRMNPE